MSANEQMLQEIASLIAVKFSLFSNWLIDLRCSLGNINALCAVMDCGVVFALCIRIFLCIFYFLLILLILDHAASVLS